MSVPLWPCGDSSVAVVGTKGWCPGDLLGLRPWGLGPFSTLPASAVYWSSKRRKMGGQSLADWQHQRTKTGELARLEGKGKIGTLKLEAGERVIW